MVDARRQDEAEHGIETGQIVMTPEGGYTEIREQVHVPPRGNAGVLK